MTKKELALQIIDRLKNEYPDAGCSLEYSEAWKLLVSVRLAAQCTDAEGEPLYLDVKSALYDDERKPLIVGGRYGLGSSDTTPAKIVAVFKNLELPQPKNHFTVGIVDDVTFSQLSKSAGSCASSCSMS